MVVPALAVLVTFSGPADAKKKEPRPVEEGIYIQGTTTPNYYQMMGRSEVVVLAEFIGKALYAKFAIEEPYVGAVDSPTLEVVYRGMSWERRVNGEDSIQWEDGSRYLLFLNYWREKGKVVRPDLFALRDASWGAVPLDGESAALHIEALRLLMGAAARPTYDERSAVLVGLIGSRNHLAASAAMYQVAEIGIASIDTIPRLLSQMDRGIVSLKVGALRVLRKMAPTLPPSLDGASLAEAIHTRIAWNSGDPVEVRLQAVEVLRAIGAPAVPFLQAASRGDPDQKVRYRAAVSLLELKG